MTESAVEQHLAVRASAGVCDLADRDLLDLRGGDRLDFLQRLVTRDVAAAAAVGGGYAALLTPRGRMVSDLSFHLRPDRILCDLPAGRGPVVHEALERYVVADDVVVAEAPESVLGLHGPAAREILARVSGLPSVPDEPWRGTRITVAGVPLLATCTRVLAECGYDLFVPRERAGDVRDALVSEGAAPFGAEAFESLRIEAGTPRFGPDLDDSTIPNDAIEDEAITHGKGCYPGQEIVVRIRSRGTPARRLRGLEVEGDRVPEFGATILFGGGKAGRVTSAVLGPSVGRVVALGYVTRRFLEETVGFEIRFGDGATTAARVVPRPFVAGASR